MFFYLNHFVTGCCSSVPHLLRRTLVLHQYCSACFGKMGYICCTKTKLMRTALQLLLLCLLFTACQKEASTDNPTNPSGNRLKKFTEKLEAPGMSFSETFNVSYDNNGRISSLVSESNAGDKFEFAYPAANRRTLRIFSDNELSIHSDIFMTSTALIDSVFQWNNTEDSSATKYVYDASKRVVRIKEYDYTKRTGSVLTNTTNYTYNDDGDLIRSIDTDGLETLFEYYPGEKYEPIDVWNLGTAQAGEKTRLIKKQTVKSGSRLIGTAEHTYTFDAQKRITSDIATTNQGYISTKTYTYQ